MPPKRDLCLRGHERTPENVNAHGSCKLCQSARVAEKYAKSEEFREGLIEKECKNCHIVKPIGDFQTSKGTPDGKSYSCKHCRNAAARDAYAKDKKNQVARSAAWNKKNARKVADNMQKLRGRNPEFYREYVRRYRKENPERAGIYDAKKRVKRKFSIEQTLDPLTAKQWQEIKHKARGICSYCDKKTNLLTMDHVTPLSKGGAHSKDNIRAVCKPCNSSKCAKDPQEYANKIGKLFL